MVGAHGALPILEMSEAPCPYALIDGEPTQCFIMGHNEEDNIVLALPFDGVLRSEGKTTC